MKICFKCKKRKALTEFYKHSKMADGHLNKCKECTKRDVKKNYATKPEYYRAYEKTPKRRSASYARAKSYAQTAAGKAAHARATKAYRLKYPERYKANTMLNNAVRDGRVIKPAGMHGHHEDYSKPLQVQWLTPHEHVHHHIKRGRISGAPRKYK